MKTKGIIYLVFIFFFYSCDNGKKEKKELSGPHAAIQLLITNSFHTSIRTPGDSLHIFQIPENKTVNDFYSVLMQSDTLLKKTLIRLGRKGTDAEIESIRENMKFFTIDKTDILQIEVYSEEEKFSCAFLDSLVHLFNEDVMAHMRDETHRKVKFIDGQLDSVMVKLMEAEEAMKEEPHQIINLEVETEVYFNEYLKLQKKKSYIQKLKDCLNRDYALCLEEASYVIFEEDKFLLTTLNKLRTLNLQKNNLQCPTKEDESCKKLDKEINEMLSNLDIYLKNVLLSMDASEKQFESIIKKMPKTKREITRNFEVNQKLYTYLLEKKTELMISGAGIVSPIRMVDRARWERK